MAHNLTNLSGHAEKRANQRGFNNEIINAIIEYADIEIIRPGGALSLKISKKMLNELVKTRTITASLAEKLRRKAVLIDGLVTITCFNLMGQEKAKYIRS